MSIFNKLKANLVQSLIGLGLFFLFIFIKTLLFDKNVGILVGITYVIYTFAAVLFILYIRSLYTKERLLPKFSPLNMLHKSGAFLLSAFAFLSLFYGLDYLQSAPGDRVIVKDALSVATILDVCIQVFMEELIFRYYMSGTLMRDNSRSNTYIYLLSSSISFSLLHIFTYNHYVLFYIFFYGIAFGMLYILTKNIGVPLGLHFANNYYIIIRNEDNGEYYAPGSFAEIFTDNLIIIIFIGLIYTWWIFRYHVLVKR